MNPSDALSHSVTALMDVPADAAFDFMCDPIALGRWSLGCMDTRPDGAVHTGNSLFDGGQGWFEIVPHRALGLIDYHLGTPERRVPRISARVIDAAVCDLEPEQCYLTLTAWRASGMDDARWHRLRAAHEVEILLIKTQCEAAYRAK
jgi:hypothetical protein